MHIVPVESVIVPPNRQRKSVNAASLSFLADSIADKGLMHPIVCIFGGVDYEEAPYDVFTLVAGFRRLEAVKKLRATNRVYSCDGRVIHPENIPVILVTDLSDIQLREAELEENILREDLTWQERTAATAELHELRLARDPQHTLLATATEISDKERASTGELSKISRAVIIAQHLDDPEVAAARNENEAFSIVARKTEKLFRAQLAEQYERPKSPHTLILGDLRVEMEKLSAGSVDCIIADPPYGMSAETFGDAAKLRHEYDDTLRASQHLYMEIVQRANLVCQDAAHLFLFCDIDNFVWLRERFSIFTEWSVQRTPLVWCKGSGGHLLDGSYGFRRTYELILFASKGKKKLTQLANDVINIPAAHDKEHAAEKPTALYSYLMSLSCNPGDSVLDPCCGGGTIFVAAHERNCVATGIELSPEYHATAQMKLHWIEEELT